ncbi:MAG: hypothetical protein WCF67_12370 [Chitinophagaceae bacterium]
MTKFVTKPVRAIKGKQRFEELVILSDVRDIGRIGSDNLIGVWEQYENSLETKYRSSFNQLMMLMDRVANLKSLPATKFRDVTPEGELIREYEFKAGDLRSYAIKIPNGKLILLGGYKNQQKEDFKRFRSLKKQYLDSLNLTVNEKGRLT